MHPPSWKTVSRGGGCSGASSILLGGLNLAREIRHTIRGGGVPEEPGERSKLVCDGRKERTEFFWTDLLEERTFVHDCLTFRLGGPLPALLVVFSWYGAPVATLLVAASPSAVAAR